VFTIKAFSEDQSCITLKAVSSNATVVPRRRHPCEKVGDAHWKIYVKPLKQTNLGVVQALFDP